MAIKHKTSCYADKLPVAGNQKLQETKDVFGDQCTGVNGGHCMLSYDLPVYHE
jgi:hypothetical protein